jgi:hypothetical protein
MNHREKVFTFGGTSWFRARLCLGGVNPPRQPSPPEPTEQTFGSHLTLPLMTLQSFPTGMWSSVASASSAATRRTCTHGHQRRIPTCARTFFAPLRTRVRTLQDWCKRNPLLTVDTSVSAFASDRYPMPAHNPIDREASCNRSGKQKSRLQLPSVGTLKLKPRARACVNGFWFVASYGNAGNCTRKKGPTQVAGPNTSTRRTTQ